MGSSTCCRQNLVEGMSSVEIIKATTVIKTTRKEKPETNICITTSTLNNKNTSDKTSSVCDIREDNEEKEKEKKKTTKDLMSPKKVTRKDIEIINDMFNEQQLNKIKAYLFNKKFFFEEMNDSTRNMIINCITYIRVKEGTVFYDLSSKDDDEDYYYIVDKGKCRIVINTSTFVIIKHKNIISTYDLRQNENVTSLKIQSEGKRAYLYMFSYKKYKSILDDFKNNLLEEIAITIKQIYLFRTCDKKVISQLASSAIIHTFRERKPIIQEDALIESLFIIGDGTVLCSKGENIIKRLTSCNIFNDIALFNKIESYYSYYADQETTVYEIKYSTVIPLCGGTLTKMISSIFISAIKKSNILSKYFSLENITIISPIFRLSYYFNDIIIRKKQKKLLIPLAGVIYQQGEDQQGEKKREVGNQGDIFGETLLNLSVNGPFPIITTIESVVLIAEWNEVLKVLKCFHNKAFSLYEKVNLLHLSENSIIKKLSELKQFQIAEEMKLMRYKENDVIMNGELYSDKLYIIYKGIIAVVINDLEVKRLKEAESFGFYSVSKLDNRPKPTFIAKGIVDCFFIEKVRYEEIVDSEIMKPYNKLKQTKSILTITIDQLFYVKDLGKGSYGNVYLVHDRNRKYALKTAEIESLKQNQASSQCYLNEKAIMSSIEHPFIVKLYTTFKTKEYIFFLMEYVEGITLRQRLEKQSKKDLRNPAFVQFYGAILCTILNYLGSRRIIHRDIKPENIMVEKNGYIKAIDFGIAKDLAGKDFTSTVIGTMWYLAPEMVLGKDYSFAVDYWSTGIILYECYYGYFPFGLGLTDPAKIYKEIAENKLTLASDPKNEVFNDFVGKLLNKNPNKRINSFSKWINHPFYSGFDFEKLLRKELTPPLDDLIPKGDCLNIKDTDEIECPFQQFMKNHIFCSSTDLGDILNNNNGEDFFSEF